MYQRSVWQSSVWMWRPMLPCRGCFKNMGTLGLIGLWNYLHLALAAVVAWAQQPVPELGTPWKHSVTCQRHPKSHPKQVPFLGPVFERN